MIALVIDNFTRQVHDELLWCMLFADDAVLIDETRFRLSIN